MGTVVPDDRGTASMTDLERLLIHLEDLIEDLETLDEPVREQAFELVAGIDTLHRMALSHLEDALRDRVDLQEIREAHPAIAWLFEAYSVGVDERGAADRALDEIRPFIRSHGGELELLDVEDGVVHLRMSGACEGCTAADVTLTQGIEEALRDGFPGFVTVVVEEDPEHVEAHDPPGPTLIQLRSGPPEGFHT